MTETGRKDVDLVGLRDLAMFEKWRSVGPLWPAPKRQSGPSVSLSGAISGYPEFSLGMKKRLGLRGMTFLRHGSDDFRRDCGTAQKALYSVRGPGRQAWLCPQLAPCPSLRIPCCGSMGLHIVHTGH